MPARISEPTRRKILALHEEGLRNAEIGVQLRIDRATVARHLRHVLAEEAAAITPSAKLTEAEVESLQAVAARLVWWRCSGCKIDNAILAGAVVAACPRCGSVSNFTWKGGKGSLVETPASERSRGPDGRRR